MPLSEKIAGDLIRALKTGDSIRVSVLRMIKSSMKNREIEKRASLTDEDTQAVLLSFAKRSRESIEQFSRAGRHDLAEKEEKELAVVQEYLPRQLGEEELKEIVKGVISKEELSGPKDIGRGMKAVMARLKGQAEGKVINRILKDMLEAS